ncbi:MAG: bifunctional phosphopantothenoylcysteine decarboxylase/phosphopantothenate--cysteine ligase CoaBC [Chloroflexi bacterium]|nr:bifunctional phosphopantothenoylcysteine decarboxylase/phosphopantothenate--cysteine ligase CoaBC [Chloroflexota bacterium]
MRVLRGARVALGVSGSIAAYKAVALASALHQAGAIVDVALTADAQRFVQPLSFQAITHRPVFSDLWAPGMETTAGGEGGHSIAHVTLGHESDVLVVAPATAHILAKLALGLADDPVSVTALAARCPLVVAPAMDAGMYNHPATAQNVATLRARGATVVEPEVGHLASGLSGLGRLADPERILDVVRGVLGRNGDLQGRSVTVTAGGTQEPIDPVRFITNRSSGKMGYAIAEAARDRGAAVTLITTPVALRRPAGLAGIIEVETAEQMLRALRDAYETADALIMAAAVADFRAASVADQKIKRGEGGLDLRLEPNPDLLRASADWPNHRGIVRVGFAAETRDLLANAAEKARRKTLDLVVANDVTASGAGFAVDTNAVTLLWPDGRQESLPVQPKTEVAEAVLDAVGVILRGRQPRMEAPSRPRTA